MPPEGSRNKMVAEVRLSHNSPAGTTADRLEFVRKHRAGGISLKDFHARLRDEGGLSLGYAAARKYHFGDKAGPRMAPTSYLAAVAKVFDVSTDWLVTGEGEPGARQLPDAAAAWMAYLNEASRNSAAEPTPSDGPATPPSGDSWTPGGVGNRSAVRSSLVGQLAEELGMGVADLVQFSPILVPLLLAYADRGRAQPSDLDQDSASLARAVAAPLKELGVDLRGMSRARRRQYFTLIAAAIEALLTRPEDVADSPWVSPERAIEIQRGRHAAEIEAARQSGMSEESITLLRNVHVLEERRVAEQGVSSTAANNQKDDGRKQEG